MTNKLTAKIQATLDAPVSKVWDAITNPASIKKYMFGTDTHTDWKKGSPITYTGEWEGKQYEDKGIIKEIIHEKILHTTYWSGLSGKEDKPENYANVIYEVEPEGNHKTKLTITQDNIDTEESKKHSKSNWNMVVEGMKKVVENA